MAQEDQNMGNEHLPDNVKGVELTETGENKQKLAEALHKNAVLPTLRTYQGDTAKFIKDKNQSVIDITLKEQEAREEKAREAEEKAKEEYKERKTRQTKDSEPIKKEAEETRASAPKFSIKMPEWNTGVLKVVLSLLLIAGTAYLGLYLFSYSRGDNPAPISVTTEIISPNHNVSISTIDRSSLKEVIDSIRTSKENGITVIRVANESGKISLEELATGAGLGMPDPLKRNLSGEYMLGMHTNDRGSNMFLILRVSDYAIAWSSMLDWESSMLRNFSTFLKATLATSTPSSDIENFSFKDLIVNNKDTRAAQYLGNTRLIYTFLDKQTILITESEESTRSLVDTYVANQIVR